MRVVRLLFPSRMPALQMAKPQFQFSSSIKTKQMYDYLITKGHRLQPSVTIRLLSKIHRSSLEQKSVSLITKSELSQAIENLSSHAHNLSHQDLTLLMETMSEIKPYQLYSRNIPFMRLLFKRLNYIHIIGINSKYLLRMLYVLEKMKFPPVIYCKYVQTVINKMMKCGIDSIDAVKFLLCILEKEYVHPKNVEGFYNIFIRNANIYKPTQMVYLLEIYKVLEPCLEKKIAYWEKKIKFKDLVSSPYRETDVSPETMKSSLEQPSEKAQKSASQNKEEEERALLKKKANDFLAQIRKEVNITKLKSDIVGYYEFEKEPLNSTLATFLVDVDELREPVSKFFLDNYKKLGLTEFGTLLKAMPKDQHLELLQEYKSLAWKFFTPHEKMLFLKYRYNYCGIPITKQEILCTIPEDGSIELNLLQIIGAAASKFLSESERAEILQAIEQSLSLNDSNNPSN